MSVPESSLDAVIEAQQARITELESLLKIEQLRSAKLDHRLKDLIRRVYGTKSEKLNEAQRELFGILEEQIKPLLAQSIAASADKPSSPRKRGGGRYPKPENLPVRIRLVDLPKDQKVGLVKIREEITEQIEYRPSLFYRMRWVRPVYAHPTKAHAPIVAALPPQVIPKAGVGTHFIAHVLTAKFVDHLPTYRQERIDARGGVWISRQARCRYIDAAAHLLISIREPLKAKILASGYVQVDETFTKLLDPERRGRSHDAYLWGYHAPHEKAIVLEFSPDRRSEILYDFFPVRWKGIVQTDGAAMYPRVFKHRPGVTHIECVAHLRRYVLDSVKSDERDAIPLLRDISELYRIERSAQALGLTHEERGLLRHAQAKPVLKRLQRQFRALERTAPPSGNLREAVTYANGRWPALVRYAKIGFGHTSIDQNAIERCFRPGKVGLRNYLFIGHPAAGWRSAVVYSVVATCRLLGVNPESYIAWVLPKLAAGTNRSTAAGLLPHDFAQLPDSEPLTQYAPSPSP